MRLLHDSHRAEYRSPFGALPLGKSLTLSLDVWDEDTEDGGWLTDAKLRVWREGRGEELLTLTPQILSENCRRFSVTMPPEEEPGLFWYYFMLQEASGSLLFYGNNAAHMGGVGEMNLSEPCSYQVTVYRPEVTPAWYRRAVCYQIFPDRFCRGDDWQDCQRRAAAADWLGSCRVVQQSWHDKPFYGYDDKGRVVRWPFFGGNLAGIRDKLLYLKSLGVTAVYLNPIFRATSNHKYDTADYRQIDPSFGTEEDFELLCAAAARLGIRIILDGVFSHTGEDSRYFNKFGNYPDLGAYQSEESLYYSWYKFKNYPEEYASWWGVSALPEVNEQDESYRRFMLGEDGVVRYWLRHGASGWRLDVADELPDAFIRDLRQAAKAEKPDSLILGEVWEDASNKCSYGDLRSYLLGGELDATMNYPFRERALAYLMGEQTAGDLAAALMSLKENYPPEHFAAALNLLGSHDTPRVLTVLSGAVEPADKIAAEYFTLTPEQRALAKSRLKLLALMQFAMRGVPHIYYGDEAGLAGFADPFNRAPYPWGDEDGELLDWYRRLSRLRGEYDLLVDGDFQPQELSPDVYACRRYWTDSDENHDENNIEEIWLVCNRLGEPQEAKVPLSAAFGWGIELLSGEETDVKGGLSRTLPPYGAEIWLFRSAAPQPIKLPRMAGVLCPVLALPPSEGGWVSSCRRFVDFLTLAGQKLWQVLPLNPVAESLSPYTPLSVFAGQEQLAAELLRCADWSAEPSEEYFEFCRNNADWLDDYALFAAICEARAGLPWQCWPQAEREREDIPRLMAAYAEGVENCRRRQYLFRREWHTVKDYANKHGIRIIGDLPIYPAAAGADVWAHRDLFLLDEAGYPLLSAGVPPDYFAAKGQNWGNPLYNWEAMRQDNYRWWRRRFELALDDFDYLRLDHFRSFAAFYAIPQGEDATQGCWLKGPGHGFFRRIERELGRLPLLAEDLGFLDREVYNLLRLAAYPGMAVYQFEPERLADAAYLSGRVLYSGTHDNQTLAGWLSARGGVPAVERERQVINELYQSQAPWVIIPLQDMFSLGDEARLNVPGQAEGNWRWQADWQQFKLTLAAEYQKMAKSAGR